MPLPGKHRDTKATTLKLWLLKGRRKYATVTLHMSSLLQISEYVEWSGKYTTIAGDRTLQQKVLLCLSENAVQVKTKRCDGEIPPWMTTPPLPHDYQKECRHQINTIWLPVFKTLQFYLPNRKVELNCNSI